MSPPNDVKPEDKVPVSKGKNKTKKKRKLKPTDFPKRPLSAYNIFFKEMRAQIMAERGVQENGKPITEGESLVAEISRLWKNLEPKARTRVELMAKEELRKYQIAVKEYDYKQKQKVQTLLKAEKNGGEDSEATEDEESEALRTKVEEALRNPVTNESFEKKWGMKGSATLPDMARSSKFPEIESSAKLPESLSEEFACKTPGEQRRLILEQELRNLEAERELKLRQLELIRLKSAASAASAATRDLSRSTSSLQDRFGNPADVFSAEERLQMMRARQAGLGRGMLPPDMAMLGRDPGLGRGMPSPDMAMLGSDSGMVPDGLGYGPDLSSFSEAKAWHRLAMEREEAFRRGYSMEEMEMLNARARAQARDYLPSAMGAGSDRSFFRSPNAGPREVALQNEMLARRQWQNEMTRSQMSVTDRALAGSGVHAPPPGYSVQYVPVYTKMQGGLP